MEGSMEQSNKPEQISSKKEVYGKPIEQTIHIVGSEKKPEEKKATPEIKKTPRDEAIDRIFPTMEKHQERDNERFALESLIDKCKVSWDRVNALSNEDQQLLMESSKKYLKALRGMSIAEMKQSEEEVKKIFPEELKKAA